jgi:hypothetical protein
MRAHAINRRQGALDVIGGQYMPGHTQARPDLGLESFQDLLGMFVTAQG